MATAPAQKQQAQTKYADVHEAEKLLEEILANTSQAKVNAVIKGHLDQRVEKLEALLPKHMKGEAPRLIERAMLTMAKNPGLEGCTPASFIRCVLEAAELGLAIDGKLAYAVPYNNKYKDANNREYWLKEVQFQISYIGMLAVARRLGVIQDCYSDVIYQADEFEAYRQNDQSYIKHKPVFGDRGKCLGAYCVITTKSGWRYELMDIADIDRIKARSKSAKGAFSPWKSDENEMRKKTVIRRGLKLYQDDPTLSRMFELEDRDYRDDDAASLPATGPNRLAASLGMAPKQEQPAEAEIEAPRGLVQEDAGQQQTEETGPQTEHLEGKEEMLARVFSRFRELKITKTEEKDLLKMVGAASTKDLTAEQCDKLLLNMEGLEPSS